MDILPEELLLAVFRRIPTSDLRAVGMVCRKWRRLTQDYSLFYRITIDSRIKQKTVKAIFKKYAENIRYVDIKNRNDANEILQYVEKCPNLIGFKLISCQGQARNITNLNNAVNARLLRNVLENCPKVSSVEIRHTTFRNRISNFCSPHSKLEKLRVKSENNLEIVERRLEEMTNLRDVRLQGVKLYDDRALIRLCTNNEESLTVLKLDIWKLSIDDNREDKLMEFIGRCRNLTKLSLQNFSANGLTDVGFAHLSDLKLLRSLVVTNAKKVTARAIMRLFYEPHVRYFEKVNLGRCPELHQLVLKFVADRCPNLKKLHLDQFGTSCPCIGAVDLQYVGERCPRLEHLELSSMGYDVGEMLPTILKKFPSLRSFKYYVRPLKDYFSEYDPIVRKSKQELPKFYVTCSLKYGIIGLRK